MIFTQAIDNKNIRIHVSFHACMCIKKSILITKSKASMNSETRINKKILLTKKGEKERKMIVSEKQKRKFKKN